MENRFVPRHRYYHIIQLFSLRTASLTALVSLSRNVYGTSTDTGK